MDLPTLRIVITPIDSPEGGPCFYCIGWDEEGSTRQDALKGQVRATGPQVLEDTPEGFDKVCAWLVAVALDGEAERSSLGLALVRMDEQAELPMDLTRSVKLAIVEVRDNRGGSWLKEWPYALTLDELLEMGRADQLARRMESHLPKPTRRASVRF